MPSNEGLGSAARVQPYRVLIAGGSYGGLATALNLLDLCNARAARTSSQPSISADAPKVPVDITVVDERDGYFHIISSPLALASSAYAPKAWTKFADIPALKSVRFIKGSVGKVDCKSRSALITNADQSLDEIQYDFFVAATGLRRVWPVVPQSSTRDAYLQETSTHIQSVKDAGAGVAVVGGGAVGIEMAAEIKLVMPEQKVTLIHSRDKLCSSESLPDEFKDRCLAALEEEGVETILGERVLDVESVEGADGQRITRLTLASGRVLSAGKVINAISKSSPSTGYIPPTALDADGFVKIAPSLNFPSSMSNSECHFAVGDIAAWSGIKRCGTSLHMGQYAAQNIYQAMMRHSRDFDGKVMELVEIPPMMGIAIGTQAVAYHPSTGVTFGKEVLKQSFEDDLGNGICWNYLRLGEASP